MHPRNLVLFLLLALGCSANGQGFGSFSHDQPFLAKDIASGAPIDLTNGIVAYWMMEEDRITRQDSTPYNRDMTDVSLAVYNTVAIDLYGHGVIGEASYTIANRTDNRLYATDSAFGGTNSFTISYWVNMWGEELNGSPHITRHNLYNDGAWAIGCDATNERFVLFAADNSYTTIPFNPNNAGGAGVWRNIVCGYDSSTQRGWVYTNGVFANQGTPLSGGLTNKTGISFPLTFACWYNPDTVAVLSALMDEIGYWNRCLNTNEITALYNSGNGLTYTNFDSVKSP